MLRVALRRVPSGFTQGDKKRPWTYLASCISQVVGNPCVGKAALCVPARPRSGDLVKFPALSVVGGNKSTWNVIQRLACNFRGRPALLGEEGPKLVPGRPVDQALPQQAVEFARGPTQFRRGRQHLGCVREVGDAVFVGLIRAKENLQTQPTQSANGVSPGSRLAKRSPATAPTGHRPDIVPPQPVTVLAGRAFRAPACPGRCLPARPAGCGFAACTRPGRAWRWRRCPTWRCGRPSRWTGRGRSRGYWRSP